MTNRERFLNVFSYKPVDRIPNYEFGYWIETLEEWKKFGLPKEINNDWDAERYFELDYYKFIPTHTGTWPEFEKKVIEETEDYVISQDCDGIISQTLKSSRSIPKYLKYPIESRADWTKYRDERLNPFDTDRIPNNINQLIIEYEKRDYPLAIYCTSMYGKIRDTMGVELVSTTLYDDRWLIEDMIETYTILAITVLEKILPKIQVDCSWWWEDICYRNGPLISPSLFKKIALPRYRRVVDLLEKYGVKIHILDCDGKIDDLVPVWLESGINCMFPLEAAHTDPFKLKKEYGKDLIMMGGVDKVQLIKGKKCIDDELIKMKQLIEMGGFIPHVDHRCPPDVTFDNYKYYLEKKREIL
jgi:uroporphyrinogen decarboxylase